MSILPRQQNISTLVSRLRDFEAASLRLGTSDLPVDLQPISKLYEDRLNQLKNSHSRSWFGDHSDTYFDGFLPVPAGHSFDVEWGFIPGFHGAHNPGWRIYSRDEIQAFLFHDIGEQIFYEMNSFADELVQQLSTLKDQTLDVMEVLRRRFDSKALSRYADRIEKIEPYRQVDFINSRIKSAPRMTRDSEEVAKGQRSPAHVQFLAPFSSIATTKARLTDLANILRNVIEAVNLSEPEPATAVGGNRIFIGHGRSDQWRVLKDFLRERLNLEYEEFNRVSAAGINTQERLSEMLDQCRFAFLVLAAEDLHGDGSLHARENVVHESGLFQGRLGWRKAIILLEEGCEEFSNIVGLGQIRFSKGNIQSCFEEVRQVLECPMCMSAIYWSRIDRVFFGNSLKDTSKIGFDDAFQYEDFAKPWSERHIPIAENFERDMTMKSYKAWMDKEDRHPY
jgi:predicted nucleotide-binding protein